MTTSEGSTISTPTTQIAEDKTPTPTTPEEKSPTPEDYGYDAPVVDDKKPAEVVDDKKPEDDNSSTGYDKDKPEDGSTGYGDKKPDEVVDDKKPEDKTDDEDKKPEEVAKEDLEKAVDDLGDRYDKNKIVDFAIKNKLSKEQLSAYVEMTKADDAESAEQHKQQVQETRNGWHKELLEDKEFGGENFALNIKRVDKVLNNIMPNTKKTLTERGSMLPPYIMRDLLNVYKTLNPKAPMVDGDASIPKTDEKGSFLEEMYN